MLFLPMILLIFNANQRPMSEMHGDCDQYALDLNDEFGIWDQPAGQIAAGQRSDDANLISSGKKMTVFLPSMIDVSFLAPPPKGKRGFEGSFGGILRVKVDRQGRYRFCLGAKVWMDLVDRDTTTRLEDLIFEMQTRCNRIFKVVVFELKPDREYFFQLAFSETERVDLLIFPE